MSTAVESRTIDTLLLEERRYPPPAEFAAEANAKPDIYSRSLGVLGDGRARTSHLVRAVHGAARVGAAVREVVPRRQAQRLLQLRRPARRRRQRRQDRLLLGRRTRRRSP